MNESQLLDKLADELERAKRIVEAGVAPGPSMTTSQIGALAHVKLEEEKVKPSRQDERGRNVYSRVLWEAACAEVTADVAWTRRRLLEAALQGQAACADRIDDLLDELVETDRDS